MRSAGSWVASPVPGLIIATIVPSLVFMAAHGAGDPWLNVYYFLFGAAMSLLVWRTGGLEAAVVVHAVNNMMAFGIVILAGQEINLDRSAGTGGAFMLVPMAVLLIVAVLLSLLAKRWKVQRTSQPSGTGFGHLPWQPGCRGARDRGQRDPLTGGGRVLRGRDERRGGDGVGDGGVVVGDPGDRGEELLGLDGLQVVEAHRAAGARLEAGEVAVRRVGVHGHVAELGRARGR